MIIIPQREEDLNI